ncbi:hypothetical protein VTL71DRAFT_11151 [Oculimacula yallundae]|uniref:Uncharacterized protein n=1 Tax=Oculimacula yallundae TaxID=86028 RepID=A0ABR4CVE0_9HELO
MLVSSTLRSVPFGHRKFSFSLSLSPHLPSKTYSLKKE